MILLLLGYMWLFIHRPFEIWGWFGVIPLERVYILTCAVLWLFLHQKSFVRNINVLGVFIVTAAILVAEFMTNTSGLPNPHVEEWLKIIFFAILLVTSVREEMELKVLLLGFSIIFFVYMLHSYYEFKFCGRHVYRMGIPRLVGIGVTLSDSNSFGASIVYFLPLLVPLWMTMKGGLAVPLRLLAIASFVLAMSCITYTGSRGAFVGFLTYIVLAIAFSQNRWKILLASVVILPIVWVNMDQRLQNRYLTLIDPSRGPVNAQQSADGRIEGFKTGMKLFQKSPLYGCGPGNTARASGTTHQTHNFIGQVAGELGSLGLSAYGFLCCCITINYFYSRFYWRILKTLSPTADSFAFQVSQAVFIAMILLLVLGLGSHNAFRYTWVWYAVFQSMAVVALKKKADDIIREHNENRRVDTEPADHTWQGTHNSSIPQPK